MVLSFGSHQPSHLTAAIPSLLHTVSTGLHHPRLHQAVNVAVRHVGYNNLISSPNISLPCLFRILMFFTAALRRVIKHLKHQDAHDTYAGLCWIFPQRSAGDDYGAELVEVR